MYMKTPKSQKNTTKALKETEWQRAVRLNEAKNSPELNDGMVERMVENLKRNIKKDSK